MPAKKKEDAIISNNDEIQEEIGSEKPAENIVSVKREDAMQLGKPNAELSYRMVDILQL
jgi:hypothetical protein